MAADRVRGRFRVAPGELAGERAHLDAREARHLMVRRLEPGARVILFDGAGCEAEAELTGLDTSGATARVIEHRRSDVESPLELWLVQALPVRLPRLDDVVRQATELGVVGVLPVVAEHSEAPGGGAVVLARKAERWRRLAEAAAKQCGRARVPEISDPVPWPRIPWDRLPRPLVILDARGETLTAAVGEPGRAASLLVGPEGGWSDAELHEALERGARVARLGPRTLRADSAGPAALALLQHLWGDLG